MLEFFQKLFATDFMPHGHCYLWRPEIVWLHVVSDGLTALAYFVIPFVLVHLVRRRRDLAFNWMFLLFGLFILACGTTHLMSILTLWHPVYRLDGLIKAVTALASVPTALLLVRLVPQAIALPSPEQLRASNAALEREVAERKLAEEQVRVLNAGLEQRVAERTGELRKANEQLQRMNDDLKHFAYAASHDLQEPLRMVVSYNQLLAKDYGSQLPEAATQFLAFSVEGALRINDLLAGLREYWQASERGENQRKPVRADAAVQTALANLQGAIDDSAAVITSGPLPTILGEEVMLIQLFQNLIANAIKYRGEQAPRIHVSAIEKQPAWLFSVEDNGLGIPVEHRETVFGVFKRLHGKDYPGVGMGLALCRKVVERHGGRIWVEGPETGGGSTFYFTIPIEAANEQ